MFDIIQLASVAYLLLTHITVAGILINAILHDVRNGRTPCMRDIIIVLWCILIAPLIVLYVTVKTK
jgi:hypothetical protein